MSNNYNGYKTMWLIASFDLPTLEKDDRRRYTRFRDLLLKNGFKMIQYSVYAKYFPSFQQGKALVNDIKKTLPPCGNVLLFYFTDKQFGLTDSLINGKNKKQPNLVQEELEFY